MTSHDNTPAADETLVDPFAELGLDEFLVRAVTDFGYTVPTPIQAAAIPRVLAGKDLFGCAQTGTGKTAAFGLPLLQKLSVGTFSRDPRALILAPTRELAMRCEEFFDGYGAHTKLRYVSIVGGMPMGPQIRALKAGVDVVIATPGRLLDLDHQGALHLGRVEMVVLDEADRMLDMGFIPDIRRIMRLVPHHRQTVMFSATMPPEIERLARDFLLEPERIEITPPATPVERIRQVLHPCDHHRKHELLMHLLKSEGWDQVLVFTRTINNAEMVGGILQREGFPAVTINGNMQQAARLRSLKAFKSREATILVATDVASRGLDIEAISHVVNYDMAATVEDYVHRIGRTARASAHGDAVTLVSVEDWTIVKEVEKFFGKTIERIKVPGFEPTICAFLADLPEDGKKPPMRRRSLLRRGRR